MFARTLVTTAALAGCAVMGATWTPDQNVTDTIIFGVSFPSEDVGYIAGSDNGAGNFVKTTTDGGKSFNPMPLNDCKPAIMLDVAFSSTTSGVSSGLGVGSSPNCYSSDGKQMNKAKDSELDAAVQSAELIGGGGFGLTGQFGKVDGVAVSKDGITYQKYDAGFPAAYPARYGSFPTATTWYVAGGAFPTNNSMPADTRVLSHFIAVHADGTLHHRFPSTPINDPGWGAVIMKTSNAGKSWTQVYNDTGRFYFNQISCADENTCVAVGEGESSNYTGAGIYATKDGGATWTEQYYGPGESMMAVNMLSATEAWVASAYAKSQFDVEGRYYHTTDGGKTWSIASTVKGHQAVDMSFISPTSAWACAIAQSASILIRYK